MSVAISWANKPSMIIWSVFQNSVTYYVILLMDYNVMYIYKYAEVPHLIINGQFFYGSAVKISTYYVNLSLLSFLCHYQTPHIDTNTLMYLVLSYIGTV